MSYGIKTFNSGGTVAIDSTEVAVRYITSIKLDRTFSGTISIPSFDSSRGAFFLSPYVFKYHFSLDIRLPDGAAFGTSINLLNQFGVTDNRFSSPKPTLSWNNTSKVMTVTQAPGALGDYKLTLLHYK
jgi:hypothetical protein